MKKYAVVLRYVDDKPVYYPKLSEAVRLQYADYEVVGFADTKQAALDRSRELNAQ